MFRYFPATVLAISCSCLFTMTTKTSAQRDNADPSAIASKIHPAVQHLLERSNAGVPVKAWVLFRPDKGLVTEATREAAIIGAQQNYNRVAIKRRRLRRTRPGLFDLADVPVPARYLTRVAATGASIHVVSRWVNGASVWTTREQLARIAELPFVERIQLVRRSRKIEPVGIAVRRGDGASPGAAGAFYGQSEQQIAQINLIALHNAGFTGAGVRIGILDTGFNRSHVAFNQPGHVVDIIAEHDFVDDDANTSAEPGDPSGQHNHGTWILGTIGAYRAGALVGAAYDASFILAKTEDTTDEYPAEEDNYVAGIEFIEANGGDVATSSLGYIDWYTQADLDGATAVTTLAVNIATGNGVHFCTAAGNAGHDSNPSTSHLIAPADAPRVITCGAASSSGAIAGFSSDGPTADGRVKPEVLAQGVDTRTVSSSNDTAYTGVSGTSLSTPLVAGAVACLVQAHPTWSVGQLRARLFETADYFVANGTFDPRYVLGYGMIDAASASAAGCDTDASCDDGITCTSDSCNEVTRVCDHLPDDAACDNGAFCDGQERCSVTDGCVDGSDPCPNQACDETEQACVACTQDSDCADAVFCNGAEVCLNKECYPGDGPCAGEFCAEESQRCVSCLEDADCDDGDSCTGVELCDLQGGECLPADISDCDQNGRSDACDLVQCDGNPDCGDCNSNGTLDVCDIVVDGVPDVNDNGVPDECESTCDRDVACDDGNVCTFDTCTQNRCLNEEAVYGDLTGSDGATSPDGAVDLADILAVLDNFACGPFGGQCSHNADIASEGGDCAPDGLVDLFDILAILDAFQGGSACCLASR